MKQKSINRYLLYCCWAGLFRKIHFQSAGAGTDAGTIARQSASKILSDQLNQLAGSLVKGVDINFDMNSRQDYSTGTATRIRRT